MGMIRPMFKLPAYRVFDYKPRTYDPKLEERREMLRQLREGQGKDMEGLEPRKEYVPGSLIRGNMRPKVNIKRRRTGSSTIRLVIYIAILSFIVYLILMTDLSSVIKYFSK